MKSRNAESNKLSSPHPSQFTLPFTGLEQAFPRRGGMITITSTPHAVTGRKYTGQTNDHKSLASTCDQALYDLEYQIAKRKISILPDGPIRSAFNRLTEVTIAKNNHLFVLKGYIWIRWKQSELQAFLGDCLDRLTTANGSALEMKGSFIEELPGGWILKLSITTDITLKSMEDPSHCDHFRAGVFIGNHLRQVCGQFLQTPPGMEKSDPFRGYQQIVRGSGTNIFEAVLSLCEEIQKKGDLKKWLIAARAREGGLYPPLFFVRTTESSSPPQ